jgi:replication factor A1
MHKTKDQLYDFIKDLKTKEEFDAEIKNVQESFDYLIDEDTTALLIIDELGRNKHNIYKINEMEPGLECTVFGEITYISTERTFNRKNGSKGRVINLEIKDDTSKCNLALWDKDVDLVKKKQIKLGTKLKIVNGYVKDGFSGLELNVGRWGAIEIDPDDVPEFKNDIDDEKIKGKINEIEPTRAFFKDSGEFGFVTKIIIQTDKKVKKLTVWDEKVKEIQKFKPGDRIEIKNYSIKENNDQSEIYINNKTTIKKI